MTAALRQRLLLVWCLAIAGTAAAALGAVFLLQATLPALTALATGGLVQQALDGSSASSAPGALAGPLLLLGGLLLAGQLIDQAVSPLWHATVRRIDGESRAEVCRLAGSAPGIEDLEDASVRDNLHLASARQGDWTQHTPGDGAVGQIRLVCGALNAALSAVVVARYSPWLVPAIVVPALITRTLMRRESLAVASVWEAGAPQARRAAYWMRVVIEPGPAKEIRLFGLRAWLIDRWRGHELSHIEPVWRKSEEIDRTHWLSYVAVTAAAFTAFAALGVAATQGGLTVAGLATALTAALGLLAIGGFDQAYLSVTRALPGVLALDRLRQRYRAYATAYPSRPPLAPPGHRPPLVRFEQVRFAYPGATRPVLDGLDLEIQPGEVLGIVGLNGAGKSTLIKLLCRLYRPTAGRITADGVDIAKVDARGWRALLAVVFQDFARYPLSAADNVVLGRLEPRERGRLLDQVGREAGFDAIVAQLPDGWETPLSSALAAGVDLSGGQWQHLALARALFAARAGARIVVLDEPTAHLDVGAELHMFRQVLRGVAGLSVVLISHRASTVREADRVVVLGDGKVVESGRHEELMATGGHYAALFSGDGGELYSESGIGPR